MENVNSGMENKEQTEVQLNEQEQKQEQKQKHENPDALGKGVLKLKTPIRANNKDVTELQYDFLKLTGWDIAMAMDADRTARNAFALSAKQAMALFAMAAARETADVDVEDIKRRIGVEDAILAIQTASLFYVAASSSGLKRISK